MKKKTPHSAIPEAVNPRRRLLFLGITFAAIAVLAAVLEIALRLFHYGADLDLVCMTMRGGKEYCYLNPLVGKRYFDPRHYALPKVETGFFLRDKPADVMRIFCLGASTTAGFPYEYNATPSRMLQKQLEHAFPGKSIEVINAGLTATNSYTVVEFARELVPFHPDAFVVYTGQNEFYGALGVGSTISAGHNGALIRLYLALRHAKTFLLCEDALSAMLDWISSGQPTTDGTLMQQMAAEKAIPIDGPLYESACASYRQNLLELSAIAAENKVPLVLSTMVTNERGLAPFVSVFGSQTGENRRKEIASAVEESAALLLSKDFEQAKMKSLTGIALDSKYALLWFRLGQCYDALGCYDSAAAAYARARDCDGLRFRAPSDFNKIVREAAKQTGIVLADVDSASRAHSPQGIIGNELLWEHVHPRLQGYMLLSQIWFHAVMKTALGAQTGRPSAILSDSGLYTALHLTNLDQSFARQKMFRLMRRWPFAATGSSVPEDVPDDTARVAMLFLDGKLRWNEAHYEMADVYLRKRDFARAAAEYQAVSDFSREDPFPKLREGDMHVASEQYEDAARAYAGAIALNDNQFARLKLGVVLIKMKQPQRALEELTRSVELDAQAASKFSRSQKNEAAYYYALALSEVGSTQEAAQMLAMILEQNPKDERAQQLLAKIRPKQGQP